MSEIRTVYNTFFVPSWNDVAAPPVPFTYGTFAMNGRPYVAVVGTLFSRNHLRLTAAQGWPLSCRCSPAAQPQGQGVLFKESCS